jgi:4'-phosphopantetheinyl transferase
MSSANVSWKAAPGGLTLVEGDVHVFCASLDVTPGRLEELVQALSDDEWQRAARFRLQRDRQRFLAGRGTLREVLGTLLKVKPASLVFSYGEFGKPQIAVPVAAHSLRFSVAHSEAVALCATSKQELGVDLERIRAMDDAEQIASRFFSPREERSLLALPAEQRLEAFFNCWTRKEAYLKAAGLGLSDCLDQIEVSLVPGEVAEPLRVPNDSRRWFLHSLFPPTGFVAALAVQQEALRVNTWEWNGPP